MTSSLYFVFWVLKEWVFKGWEGRGASTISKPPVRATFDSPMMVEQKIDCCLQLRRASVNDPISSVAFFFILPDPLRGQ